MASNRAARRHPKLVPVEPPTALPQLSPDELAIFQHTAKQAHALAQAAQEAERRAVDLVNYFGQKYGIPEGTKFHIYNDDGRFGWGDASPNGDVPPVAE